jgi:hypothetical protein
MIPASERAKTVPALDRSATVTGKLFFTSLHNYAFRTTCLYTVRRQGGYEP